MVHQAHRRVAAAAAGQLDLCGQGRAAPCGVSGPVVSSAMHASRSAGMQPAKPVAAQPAPGAGPGTQLAKPTTTKALLRGLGHCGGPTHTAGICACRSIGERCLALPCMDPAGPGYRLSFLTHTRMFAGTNSKVRSGAHPPPLLGMPLCSQVPDLM